METFKVLFVDDLKDCRWLMQLYLRHTDIQLILASSAIEAFQAVKQHNPDLILMDIQMPEVTGYDAVVHLRNIGFYKPIIAFTAHAMSTEVQKCFDVGCDDVLTKPIRKHDLLGALLPYAKLKSLASGYSNP